MEIKDLNILYKSHPKLTDIHIDESNKKIQLKGLHGSSKAFIISNVINKKNDINLFILNDKEEAAYAYNDLIAINKNGNILFFPTSHKRSIQYFAPDNENIVIRAEVLKTLSEFKIENKTPLIIISYPEAIIEKVVTKEILQDNTLKLHVKEKISTDFLLEVLTEYHFERVDFVYEPGQFSMRGSIIDIFSYSSELPYRIDFFGDEVDSIRTFSIDTQLSDEMLDNISIMSNIQNVRANNKLISFLDFIPEQTKIITTSAKYIIEKTTQIYALSSFEEIEINSEIVNLNKDDIIESGENIKKQLSNHFIIEVTSQSFFKPEHVIEFSTAPQPPFNKNFEILGEELINKTQNGFSNYILSDSKKQIERLEEIFNEIHPDIKFTSVNKTIHEGFVDNDLRINCYTDHQIFERYHKFKLKSNFSNKAAITLNELNGLNPGDFIVHIDHGIGRFGGLEKIEVNGIIQEAIRLIYKDNDILFVNIHNLHKISKYKGKDSEPPKIYKLGTGAWQKLKQNTKNKVKDIAKDLIALYAKRRTQQGFQFSPDSYLQQELEASFIYEDTPDQEKATKTVKEGMESSSPMDVLICGDVGFGKTEVAIRAAFKAVTDSKQVAILVPTTILALQHYNTFIERLDNFPCTVDYISRFKSTKEQTETLKKLKSGKIDILIGTHRIVGNDIIFKDLGLLIIDEEQKFGVAVKEKLKKFKLNVDTLTLTATPIPRTLQFSLMGVRDLSIINTPPPNRHPIVTELHTFNEDIIKEAILYEIERDGQVFIIHNRVQNINEIETLVNKIAPGIKTVVAHGQLEGKKLEKIMMDFIAGKYDVLIATTIIESGLDIPNTNTIIINNAQTFGLSDLHQLRGRVGRSNKKAFCYLLAPPLTSVTPEARRRLKAIEEFSDLGSGFNIALQDLDIRGAGNLLGGEQSGFIADIGFETYHKILNEAIQELKEDEFYDLFKDDKADKEEITFITDCLIDTDMEIHFPQEYIYNTSERIKLYRELDNINNEIELEKFAVNLVDRFGQIPKSTEELLKVVELRWIAIKLGFTKIILKKEIMIIHFISNQLSPYYQSPIFANIIKFIQQHHSRYKVKEEKDKLTLTVRNIKTVSDAINVLKNLKGN